MGGSKKQAKNTWGVCISTRVAESRSRARMGINVFGPYTGGRNLTTEIYQGPGAGRRPETKERRGQRHVLGLRPPPPHLLTNGIS